jgi:error-prone DNA polymerase
MRNGLSADEANDVYDKLLGFASYGFCKSHAASFARLSYITAWLKWHHPGEFYCGILNAQPMGFYSVEVLIEDAKRHAIRPLPIDINRSWTTWELEDGHLRVPITRLRGMHDELAERIVDLRERDGLYDDLWDFVQRARPPRHLAERLVRAGALDFTGRERRQLLWQLGDMQWREGELAIPPVVLPAPLPPTTATDEVASDYGLLGLAQGQHILALYRPHLAQMGVVSAAEATATADGESVRVAGRVEIVQRPQLAKGIVFGAIEDETGMVNLLLYPDVYERFRRVFRESPVIIAEGRVQHEHGALHVIIDRLIPVELGEPEAGAGEGLRPEDIPAPSKLFR